MALSIKPASRTSISKKRKKSEEAQGVLDRLKAFLDEKLPGLAKWLAAFWGLQAAAVTHKQLRRIAAEEDTPDSLTADWHHDYAVLASGKMADQWRDAFMAGVMAASSLAFIPQGSNGRGGQGTGSRPAGTSGTGGIFPGISSPGTDGIFPNVPSPGARIPNPAPTPSGGMGSLLTPTPSSVSREPLYNPTEETIRNWIQNRAGELITNCTNEQLEAIRHILAESKANQMSVDETARLIRPTIGLTKPQAAANLKYYQTMKENLRKEHPRMKEEAIEKKARDAAAKYAEKQIRYRAKLIAETELASAYNHGVHEAIRDGMASGRLPVMKEIWSTAKNDRVCEACQDLEGMEVGFDEEFSVDVHSKRNPERVLRTLTAVVPPLHPRCHCALMYVEAGLNVDGGLASSGNDILDSQEHDAPVLLENIDVTDEKVVKSRLEKYEKSIASKETENAIVICQDGNVYQCFGTLNNVYPDADLGNRIYGSYMTHNHPIGSDHEYSFSERDIILFLENNLTILRGIDDKFVYELTRNPLDIDENVSVFEIDEDSARHEQVIGTAREYGIGYRRWRHD